MVTIRKQRKKECFFLLAIYLLITWVIVGSKIFGNRVDWLNQHVALADLLRQKMRMTGHLVPPYIGELMGGANPYSLSYYGLFRPDVIFGAFFPEIPMVYIVSTYSYLLLLASVVLTYIFLLKNEIHEKISLGMAILVFCTSLFFHSHKQIMFVNYMPFLLWGLLSIDRYLEKKQLLSFILAAALMIGHSYFYTISNIMVCWIYFFYKNDWKWKKEQGLPFIFSGLIAILLTGILTVPTLAAILSSSKSVTATNYFRLLLPQLNLKALLYDAYGCGFSYLAYMCLILGVFQKKMRTLSVLLLLIFIFPVFCFICNGFLYARGKILIAFIPLVALVMAKIVQGIYDQEICWGWKEVCLFLVPLLFIKNPWFVGLDLFLTTLSLFLIGRRPHIQVFFLPFLIPFIVLTNNNPPSSFITQAFYKKYMDLNQVEGLHSSNAYRLSIGDNQIVNSNNTGQGYFKRATGYSSTYNDLYNQYLYNQLENSIATNNRINHLENDNRIYLGMMGVRDLLYKKEHQHIPLGYHLVRKTKNYNYYHSNEVLPIVYATDRTLAYKKYASLRYPYNLDLLYNRALVENGELTAKSQFVKEEDFLSAIQDPYLNKEKDGYFYQSAKKHTIDLPLRKVYTNQLIAIDFQIRNYSSKKVTIQINGEKNRLSSKKYPYFNHNTHFHFLLNAKSLDRLKITFSPGIYKLGKIHVHRLDYSVIQHRAKEVDPMRIQWTDTGFKGKIKVKKDGYLVTSIPFDKGYRIKIDGKEVKADLVNTAFIGSPIKKGKHTVCLDYEIPAYKLGLCSTGLGLAALLGLVIVERKNHEKKHERTL